MLLLTNTTSLLFKSCCFNWSSVSCVFDGSQPYYSPSLHESGKGLNGYVDIPSSSCSWAGALQLALGEFLCDLQGGVYNQHEGTERVAEISPWCSTFLNWDSCSRPPTCTTMGNSSSLVSPSTWIEMTPARSLGPPQVWYGTTSLAPNSVECSF